MKKIFSIRLMCLCCLILLVLSIQSAKYTAAQSTVIAINAGGGANGSGTIFKITLTGNFSVLHRFSASPQDGSNPHAGLIQARDGNLYGTTNQGGDASCGIYYVKGCGVVFKLTPPTVPGGAWTQSVIYTFCSQANCADGSNSDGLLAGAEGTLYGTGALGGRIGARGERRAPPTPRRAATPTAAAARRWRVARRR